MLLARSYRSTCVIEGGLHTRKASLLLATDIRRTHLIEVASIAVLLPSSSKPATHGCCAEQAYSWSRLASASASLTNVQATTRFA